MCNNPHFSDKAFFVEKWYDSRLRPIKDILNENGNIALFHEVKQKFKIDGHFLTYAKVLAVIPRIWKRLINTVNRPIHLNVYKRP